MTGRQVRRAGLATMPGRLTLAAAVLLVALADIVVRSGGGSPHTRPVADSGLPALAAPLGSAVPLATATASTAPTARPRTRVSAGATGSDVHGTVVDAAGRPLAGVHVAYDESMPDAPGFRDLGVTDARGHFAVPCESRNFAPEVPDLMFTAYDAQSGVVDAAAPDIAWTPATQQCGPRSGPAMRVVAGPAAVLEGTLFDHCHPSAGGVRVGVSCDGMPRGLINAFVAQVSARVSGQGHYRISGLRSDRCAVGVFSGTGRQGRELVEHVQVFAGRTTTYDVYDDGQDKFPGHQQGGSTPSPHQSPSSDPSPLCLPVCARNVPDRP